MNRIKFPFLIFFLASLLILSFGCAPNHKGDDDSVSFGTDDSGAGDDSGPADDSGSADDSSADDDSSVNPADDTSGDDSADDTVDLGTATVTPSVVPAASLQRFTVEYTVGQPIEIGGKIKFYFAPAWSFLGSCQMNVNSSSPCGYATITTSNLYSRLNVTIGNGPTPAVRLYEPTAVVQRGPLSRGDKVTLVYGANEGMARVQEIAQRTEVTVRVSLNKDMDSVEIGHSPILTVTPLDPFKLVSAVDLNGGNLKLSVVDQYANLAEGFSGAADVTLVDESMNSTSLGSVAIMNGTGMLPLPTVDPGYYVLRTEVPSVSLASQVPYAPGEQMVFFGDIHFHTKISDSYTAYDPLDAYEYGKNVSLLDFLASSDHAECTMANQEFTQFLIRNIGDSWVEVMRIDNLYNNNGFPTLVGFEMTGSYWGTPRVGHINVYYRWALGRLYPFNQHSLGYPVIKKWSDLWTQLDGDGAEALTIPHHTLLSGPRGTDWTEYDPKYVRVVEIYSEQGCSESTTCTHSTWDPANDPDALGAVQRAVGPLGYRLGFIGSSDSHASHPAGTGMPDPFFSPETPGGLVAVVADTLTRDTVWSAMHDRSVYATNGERIHLEFSVNGQQMGTEITYAGSVNITARAVGTGDIETVEVLKYDSAGWRDLVTFTPTGPFWNGSTQDDNYTESSIYYLKVTQSNGGVAWGSPVWVDQP